MRKLTLTGTLFAGIVALAWVGIAWPGAVTAADEEAAAERRAADTAGAHAAADPTKGKTHVVTSPDGTLRAEVAVGADGLRYRVQRFGRDVIGWSPLGIALKGAPPLGPGMRVDDVRRESVDRTWALPWGESAEVRDRHEALTIGLVEAGETPRRMTLAFRVFDDGVGFRYEWPAQDHLGDADGAFAIMDEQTGFAIAGDPAAWWIPAWQRDRYEYLYERSPVSSLGSVHTPLTMETADGLVLSIHEAALTDYASMVLKRTEGTTLTADLVPWWDGVKVRAQTPHVSPWRTIHVVDTPGDLVTSNLILNLNEPSRIEDPSWVKPGKYVGIWWAMHIRKSTWGAGPRHGATTARAKRLVDFAAAHGLDGVLIEGWNVGWNGPWRGSGTCFDFTTPYPDFDIEAVARYAEEKGVEIIGHHETGGGVPHYEAQMEAAFDLYDRLGIERIKTGYVDYAQGIEWAGEGGEVREEWHHGQYMVRHYRRVVEAAARHGIMLDVHEPIKATGVRRTWPNMMTREGARGQEYNAWSGDGGNPPDHTTILPFTRLLGGPMDFTPGIFDITLPGRPDNRVNTTLAKQLALYVVIYSPLQMAADLPENYEANPAPFRFIEDVPVDWAETRVVHGRIGDYVTIVRKDRASDDWYLGSVTDEHGRTLELTPSFLEPGRRYVAEIYRDAADADWVSNPTAIEILSQPVTATTPLTLRLAPGGGQAIRFRAE